MAPGRGRHCSPDRQSSILGLAPRRRATNTVGSMEEPNLVLDEIEERFHAFQLVRKSDDAAKAGVLEELGASDDVDADIILELSSVWPLGHPERFDSAHALVIRALEVLDRNGARGVRTHAPIGPLNHVAAGEYVA